MRVGTRPKMLEASNLEGDHPHACGDKKFMKQYLIATSGSSPCVWGQVFSPVSYGVSSRIIPMRVGTSIEKVIYAVTDRDHPHACGDK